MRSDRPFSCPNCKQVVAPIGAYHKYWKLGCFSFLTISIAVAIFVGRRASLGTQIASIVCGFLVGISGAIFVANALVWGLQRMFPRSAKLRQHIFRDEPKLLKDTADFLDSVRELPEWSERQDHTLEALWTQRSADDALENEALVAARELKARLTNSSEMVKHVSGDIRKLNLKELREELAAIAIDLRIAAR